MRALLDANLRLSCRCRDGARRRYSSRNITAGEVGVKRSLINHVAFGMDRRFAVIFIYY